MMEMVGGGRRRGMVMMSSSSSSSPERTRRIGFVEEREREKQQQQQQLGRRVLVRSALVRKVEIVYYLSRNGQLEHPHFMELSQLPNQQLTLRDVLEKLAVLRGRGMPSLFSWSCKRSYKNGYVWNDLSENDVIYPADGAEYVLKGSEIISGCTSVDRFQPLALTNRPMIKALSARREQEEEEDDDEEQEEEIGKDASNSWHCSRGVSTEGMIVVHKAAKVAQTEIAVEDGSPALSRSSSDPVAAEPSASGPTRNSVFLQLIACGHGSAAAKGGRKSGSLHAGVVTGPVAAGRSRLDEDHGFGGLKGVEDKEYFSGSIMEIIRKPVEGAEPKLKKSSSFDEQRSSKLGLLGEGRLEVNGEGRDGVKGKCIPGRKRSSFKLLLPQQTKK